MLSVIRIRVCDRGTRRKHVNWWRRRRFDRCRCGVWLLNTLQREELSYIVLRVACLHRLQRVLLQIKLGQLTGPQQIGRRDNRGNCIRSRTVDFIHSASCCVCIAWITRNKYVTPVLRRDWETMLLLEARELSLLLPPFGAAFALGAFVGFRKQLLNSDDRDRFGWRNDVVACIPVSSSPSSPTASWRDGCLCVLALTFDTSGLVPMASLPILTLRPLPGLCARSFGVFERRRNRNYGRDKAIGSSERVDLIPQFMAFAEGLDLQFLQIVKLQIEQDGSCDIVGFEPVDDVVLKTILVHPCGDFLRRPRPHLCAIEMSNSKCNVVVLSPRNHRLRSRFAERRLQAGRWFFGEQWR